MALYLEKMTVFNILLAVMMQAVPTQATQLMRLSVRMLENRNTTTAATPTKTAVQAPCDDTVFRPMEILKSPEAAVNMKTIVSVSKNVLQWPQRGS